MGSSFVVKATNVNDCSVARSGASVKVRERWRPTSKWTPALETRERLTAVKVGESSGELGYGEG